MKKLLFIIVLILGLNSITKAQSSYAIIGNDEYMKAMFYFEVTDSYSSSVMKGVKVDLLDGRVLVASAYTNNRGAALFLFSGPRFLRDNMIFRIQKESYSPWEYTLEDQYDVIEYIEDHMVGIPYRDRMDRKWYHKPSTSVERISDILNGNFEYTSEVATGYSGKNCPGMMEFKVSLNYDRHPSEQQYHRVQSRTSNEVNNNSGSVNQNNKQEKVPEVWVNCGFCNGTGKCYNCNGTGIEGSKSAAHNCSDCRATGKCRSCQGKGKRRK